MGRSSDIGVLTQQSWTQFSAPSESIAYLRGISTLVVQLLYGLKYLSRFLIFMKKFQE